jgi:hypothetical protein
VVTTVMVQAVLVRLPEDLAEEAKVSAAAADHGITLGVKDAFCYRLTAQRTRASGE